MAIEIGHAKQLFVDDYIVEKTEGLRRVMHQPEKHPGNPILRAEMPWEKPSVYLYGTVLRDESSGQFKMWYQSLSADSRAPGGFTCYAVSSDGINWERPELGIFEFQGSTCNNIVLEYDVPSVIHLSDETDPQKRYRAFVDGRTDEYLGYCTAASPDGLHWSTPRPIYSSGDVAQFCYDPASGIYTTFAKLRAFNAGFLRRSICTKQTGDPEKWDYFNVSLIADAEDDRIARERLAPRRDRLSLWHPETVHGDFYGLSGFSYEGLYLGMLWVFHISSSKVASDDGLIDIALVSSRNVTDHWNRLGNREPFIPLGEPREWDSGMLFTASAPVRVGDELWIYYGGANRSHYYVEDPERATSIGLAKLRLDGFVSLDASEAGGFVVTEPLTFEGNRLEINARADGGEIRIELWDGESGKVIPGFSKEAFEIFRGDSVAHEAVWRDSPGLDTLTGRPVRLKFYLHEASLFAFGFSGPTPNGSRGAREQGGKGARKK
jgi:hypothetical protein